MKRCCLLIAALAAAQTPARRDSVVVTGSFEPIPLDEADRPVTALDVRSLGLLSNTWVDLLRLDPALDLRQRGPNGTQADLSIQGGTFGQTLVLLNGMRLNDPQSGHHNLDVPVPLESLSRIEVLRSSGSTLYGSDAVGGVVNFITRPPEGSEIRLRTALGNFGVNQQRGSLAGALGKLSGHLAFSRDFSSGFLPNRDYRNLSFASTAHLDKTEINLAHSDRPFGAEGFYGDYPSWERTRTWFASARQGFGNTEAAFAYRRHSDDFVLYRDRPEVFTNRHAAESYQAHVRRHEALSQNATLHYGVEGYRDAIESSNLGRHSRERGAVYAALDVRALRRFSFSLGARQEEQFSPSASAGVWLSPRLKLRAGISHAFRRPSYTDLYYHDPANLGSPDLRPERAWSTDAGLDWNAGKGIHGDVNVFQRRERDDIDYVRRAPGDIWRATNVQRLRFTGVAASVGVDMLNLRYAWLHGSGEPPAGMMSRYVFTYPEHAAVISWQHALPRGLSARTRFGATRRRGRDPYALWDAYIARGRGIVKPFLQFTNLTGATYEEIAGVRMPGRSVVAGFEIVVKRSAKTDP